MPNNNASGAAIHIASLIFFTVLSVAALNTPAIAITGNFEIEARVHVVWGPEGEQLNANGARNTLGELDAENRKPVFIDHAKGIIAIDGRKYFRRNLTSGDVVLLLGITNANLSSPMRDSEYLSKNYVTSVFGFYKIYVAEQKPGWNASQLSFIVPTGRKYFLVNYSDIGAHSFVISVFNPLDSIFETDPQPIDPDKEKDGLEFTPEDIEEFNRLQEEEEAQMKALEELGLTDPIDENLLIEDDKMMLVACAAEHDACKLEADPENIREFMKLSSKAEAEAELKREIASRSE